MISRYSLDEMVKIWTQQNKFQKMLDVEILSCEAMAKLGKVPAKSLEKIRKKAKFDINRIKQIEEKTHHDVVAFLESVSENVGSDSRFIHMGLTSSDVLDTALSLQLRESIDIITKDVKNLVSTLKSRARKHKNTLMMGRTHGVHAEPMTFGLKMALWYTEMLRHLDRLKNAREIINVGKLSGAVGTYANIDPRVEAYVCKKLALKQVGVSTQVLQRDRHAQFIMTLALIAASLEKFATEIRALQKTEVLEVEEPFVEGQKGSSAMPHKRNPVKCEQIVGLARIVRSHVIPALENISLWHERDISHSSVERVIFPDSCILINYMLNKFNFIMQGLIVYPDNMKKNIDKTKDAIFSSRILVELLSKGLSRENAYILIQQASQKAWRTGKDLKTLMKNDWQFRKIFTDKQIDSLFDLKHYVRNVNRIFKNIGI